MYIWRFYFFEPFWAFGFLQSSKEVLQRATTRKFSLKNNSFKNKPQNDMTSSTPLKKFQKLNQNSLKLKILKGVGHKIKIRYKWYDVIGLD